MTLFVNRISSGSLLFNGRIWDAGSVESLDYYCTCVCVSARIFWVPPKKISLDRLAVGATITPLLLTKESLSFGIQSNFINPLLSAGSHLPFSFSTTFLASIFFLKKKAYFFYHSFFYIFFFCLKLKSVRVSNVVYTRASKSTQINKFYIFWIFFTIINISNPLHLHANKAWGLSKKKKKPSFRFMFSENIENHVWLR